LIQSDDEIVTFHDISHLWIDFSHAGDARERQPADGLLSAARED